MDTKGQVVAHVRVSTADQNEARQLEAIGEVDRLLSEKVSGKSLEREQLEAMLAYVREGDVVRVKSPDRLSRSTRDLLSLVEALQAKGVDLEFIDNPSLNTDTPQGEFMLTILGAVAQLERAVARERPGRGHRHCQGERRLRPGGEAELRADRRGSGQDPGQGAGRLSSSES